jgi:hypothetical protein
MPTLRRYILCPSSGPKWRCWEAGTFIKGCRKGGWNKWKTKSSSHSSPWEPKTSPRWSRMLRWYRWRHCSRHYRGTSLNGMSKATRQLKAEETGPRLEPDTSWTQTDGVVTSPNFSRFKTKFSTSLDEHAHIATLFEHTNNAPWPNAAPYTHYVSAAGPITVTYYKHQSQPRCF